MRVALDNREQIVEIMRHTCGQLPDGIHLLRLAQLTFQIHAFGNILRHQQHARFIAKLETLRRQQRVTGLVFPFRDTALPIAHGLTIRKQLLDPGTRLRHRPERDAEQNVADQFLPLHTREFRKTIIQIHEDAAAARQNRLRHRTRLECF